MGSITLTPEDGGQPRVVEIDDIIVEIDGTTGDMHLSWFVYDEASGDYVSALVYCADDFDAVFIAIGDDDYYDPAYSSIAPDILSNYFLK